MNRQAPRRIGSPFKLSDGTTYVRFSDGSWRREPPKVGGRERKRARCIARRNHGLPDRARRAA